METGDLIEAETFDGQWIRCRLVDIRKAEQSYAVSRNGRAQAQTTVSQYAWAGRLAVCGKLKKGH